MFARALALKVHRIIGLTIGMPLVAIGISGSILVLHDGIGADESAAEVSVTAPSVRAIRQTLETVSDTLPDARIVGIRMPGPTAGPLTVLTVDSDGSALIVLADAETGEVVGIQEPTWADYVREIHTALLVDALTDRVDGRHVAGAAGSLGAALVIIGFGLWWTSHRNNLAHFGIYGGGNWKRSVWDIHSTVGLAAAGPLFVLFVTGAIFALRGAGAPELVPSTRAVDLASMAMAPDGEPHLRVARWIAAADAALPGGTMTEILLPTRDGESVRIRKRFAGDPFSLGQSYVALDPATGAVRRMNDIRDADSDSTRADRWIKSVHTGRIGGSTGKLLVLLSGAIPAGLLMTGLLVWLNRRKAWRHIATAFRSLCGRDAASRPPAQGGHAERFAEVEARGRGMRDDEAEADAAVSGRMRTDAGGRGP